MGNKATLKEDVGAIEALPREDQSVDLSQLTPMMRQYLETKAAHPESILFFRLGDFYEMFFEDAVKAAELLQITLTSRSKGSERVPMCGVPYHSARRYIAKLISHGLKVAICEQTEEAGGPGIVRREVVRVITPGMVLDEEVLEGRQNNFLVALLPPGKKETVWGMSWLDASTGEFAVSTPGPLSETLDWLAQLAPREVLVPESARQHPEITRILSSLAHRPALATLGDDAFEGHRAWAYLRQHFRVKSLAGFGLDEMDGQLVPAAAAAAAALRYLKNTQKTQAEHVDRLRREQRSGYLQLDDASVENLELLRTSRDGNRKGSLLGVLDSTLTHMGARKLARWIVSPLADLPAITLRLDAVDELSKKGVWREEFTDELRGMGDVERLSARLALGVGNARDLRDLGRALSLWPKLASLLERCQAPLFKAMTGPLMDERVKKLGEHLSSAIADEPPVTLKEGGLFRPGYNAELDKLVNLSTAGKDFLLQLESREREKTGISSLKVRYNKVFGYFIEITKANLAHVPKEYIRKQTTVSGERFVTPELKEYEEKVLTAEDERCALEYELFLRLREQVVALSGILRAAAEAVAGLDVILSLAKCAAEYGYVRPELDNSVELEIEEGRHPVVERMLKDDRFVPNDIRLDGEKSQLLIITGPNMAGKSTAMRQVALIVLMAQMGSFVPARRAKVGLCDKLFTRVGAADNLARGQSTFMVEMSETANILNHATAKSLVILDEIGRGTSTFDGLSIAWAVAEHLHNKIGARTLFATHYHELTDLVHECPRVKNCSIAVREQEGRIIFLRKLIEGAANRSYGIEVARLAGLPTEVIKRARVLLENLESDEFDELGRPRLSNKPLRENQGQLALFANHEAPPQPSVALKAWVDELTSLSVEHLTPLQALTLVDRWKKDITGK